MSYTERLTIIFEAYTSGLIDVEMYKNMIQIADSLEKGDR